eukprot:3373979-Heterocapsa_arctica.AAC.1
MDSEKEKEEKRIKELNRERDMKKEAEIAAEEKVKKDKENAAQAAQNMLDEQEEVKDMKDS